MTNDFIDYGKLIDDAMRIILEKALKFAAEHGLPGSHHFYISFATKHPEVKLSQRLREKYPDEMTIVLQHQFENLQVSPTGFQVSLSFDGIREIIFIPFNALVSFTDPSVKFGLQFRQSSDYESGYVADIESFMDIKNKNISADKIKKPLKISDNPPTKTAKKSKKSANVVSIDKFRKK